VLAGQAGAVQVVVELVEVSVCPLTVGAGLFAPGGLSGIQANGDGGAAGTLLQDVTESVDVEPGLTVTGFASSPPTQLGTA